MRNLIELVVSLGLEIWLVGLLLRRDVHRHFPIFFSYVVCAALSTAARLLVVRHYYIYFYVYWWTDTLLILLSLLALHKVFRWVFEGLYTLGWFRLIYFGGIAIVLAAAIGNAILNPPLQAHPLFSLVLEIGLAVYFIRIGIVALFYIFTRVLAVDFRRYPFGIAAGFGLASMGQVAAYFVRSEFGTKTDIFFKTLIAMSYILALAIWAATFMHPESEEHKKEWTPPMSPEAMLEDLQSYLRILGFPRKKK